MFKHIDDEVTRDGFTLRARIEHDGDTGAPWEEHDGHGPVSDWQCRDKRPGELVLSGPSYGMGRGTARRFYDFAEACRIARRDGWNAAPYDVPGETPRQRAAKAARADFERLRAWCEDQWNWCGVVVTASRAGVELGTASLWGIESDAGDRLLEVANELTEEALAEAADEVREIAA